MSFSFHGHRSGRARVLVPGAGCAHSRAERVLRTANPVNIYVTKLSRCAG